MAVARAGAEVRRLLTTFFCLLLLASPAAASVVLEAASTEYLESTNTAFNGTNLTPPFLVIAWGKATNATALHGVWGQSHSSTGGTYHLLRMRGDVAGDPAQVGSRDAFGTVFLANTTTGYSADTWQAVAGFWKATNDRRAYVDGGSKGTGTDSVTVDPLDRIRVGDAVGLFDGKIAEVAIYDCTGATDVDVEQDIADAYNGGSGGNGANPTTLTACTLIEYWSLFDGPDGHEGKNLTENGAGITYDTSDHPPVDGPPGVGRRSVPPIIFNYVQYEFPSLLKGLLRWPGQ